MVECDLAKVEVAGSNPVSRSNNFLLVTRAATARAPFYGAPSPRGKAEVCKTSTPGSNPGGASNFPKKSRGFAFARASDVPRLSFCPTRRNETMCEEPRNEEEICGVVVAELEKLSRCKLTVIERPDKVKTDVERREQPSR